MDGWIEGRIEWKREYKEDGTKQEPGAGAGWRKTSTKEGGGRKKTERERERLWRSSKFMKREYLPTARLFNSGNFEIVDYYYY